jgi:hypothetical protein
MQMMNSSTKMDSFYICENKKNFLEIFKYTDLYNNASEKYNLLTGGKTYEK